MKSLSLIVAVIGCVSFAEAIAISTASAEVVDRTVTMRHGPMGHGCRTIRTVTRGPMGKRVVVRKVCR